MKSLKELFQLCEAAGVDAVGCSIDTIKEAAEQVRSNPPTDADLELELFLRDL